MYAVPLPLLSAMINVYAKLSKQSVDVNVFAILA